MIDWVTGLIPCFHKRLPAGKLVSITSDGEVDWEVDRRLLVRGSHESSIQIRSEGVSQFDSQIATHLYFDGNPSKFLQGHNIVGSDYLQVLVSALYQEICSFLKIPLCLQAYKSILDGNYDLKRIDINYMYLLNTLEDVRAFLYASEFHAKTRHGRPTTKGGTVYFGKNSRRWSLKAYSKYDEINCGKKSHTVAAEIAKTGIVDWTKNKVRLELVLRSLELKKLGLDHGFNWDPETPFNIFQKYIGHLEMSRNCILSDKKLSNLPRRLQSSYLHWKQGANLRNILPKPTFFRHRKALLDYGIDINSYCESIDKSNVIPLIRVLEAKPVGIPSWIYEKGLVFNSNHSLKKTG